MPFWENPEKKFQLDLAKMNELRDSENDLIDHITKLMNKHHDKIGRLFDISERLLKLEKFDIAEVVNKQMMTLYPLSYLVLWQRAFIFFGLGKNVEAFNFYDRAIENATDNEVRDVLLSKGEALFQIELFDDAVECFNRILKDKPLDIEALNQKALALHYTGKTDKAHEINDKVLKLDPENQEGHRIHNIISKNFDE